MSVRGRWHVIETPGYDMAAPGAYILFDRDGGEFAFDCLTGSILGACNGDVVEFSWNGNDEMEPASGEGWAELQDDGSLQGRDLPPERRRYPLRRSSIDYFFNSLLERFPFKWSGGSA
jgi:hypothetical protein